MIKLCLFLICIGLISKITLLVLNFNKKVKELQKKYSKFISIFLYLIGGIVDILIGLCITLLGIYIFLIK